VVVDSVEAKRLSDFFLSIKSPSTGGGVQILSKQFQGFHMYDNVQGDTTGTFNNSRQAKESVMILRVYDKEAERLADSHTPQMQPNYDGWVEQLRLVNQKDAWESLLRGAQSAAATFLETTYNCVTLASSHILFQSVSGQTVFLWHEDNDENNGHCSAVVTVIAFLGGTAKVVPGVDFKGGEDGEEEQSRVEYSNAGSGIVFSSSQTHRTAQNVDMQGEACKVAFFFAESKHQEEEEEEEEEKKKKEAGLETSLLKKQEEALGEVAGSGTGTSAYSATRPNAVPTRRRRRVRMKRDPTQIPSQTRPKSRPKSRPKQEEQQQQQTRNSRSRRHSVVSDSVMSFAGLRPPHIRTVLAPLPTGRYSSNRPLCSWKTGWTRWLTSLIVCVMVRFLVTHLLVWKTGSEGRSSARRLRRCMGRAAASVASVPYTISWAIRSGTVAVIVSVSLLPASGLIGRGR